jgi:3-deoxy-D-arabino-heptulosonate 7-phosphate (DAHP) synthase
VIKDFLCPIDDAVKDFIERTRLKLKQQVHDAGNKFVVITGPPYLESLVQSKMCLMWIKSKKAVVEVAERLKPLCSNQLSNVEVVMNLNVCKMEKIHGMVSQPYFLTHGLVSTRLQLLELAQHVPLIGCVDDPIAQVYFDDLYSMGLITGLCSNSVVNVVGRSDFPVGMRGDPKHLDDLYGLIEQIKHPRLHLGVMNLGQVGVIQGQGNPDVVLVVDIQKLDEIAVDKLRGNIIINVGTTSAQEYKSKSELIRKILSSSLKPFITGFIVDSGASYVEEEQSFDENEETAFTAITEDINAKKSHVGKTMLNSLVSSYSKISSYVRQKDHSAIPDLLVYADKLINDIDSFS